MKMFLGKNADQIASAANNNNSKERRSFYRKAIKKIKNSKKAGAVCILKRLVEITTY